MEKIVEVGSWPRMSDQCVQFIKVSSRGLIGQDRKQFLEKRAAHHHFVDAIDSGRIKLAKGDLPIHILAVGATEGYGCNRNGDGFNEATCRSQHPTFAKHAKYFRHHRNKLERNDPYYGAVKLSAYNEPMRRIECLTIGNMDKEAADRNGGLVMLPDTLATIDRGGDVAWSMACRLPADECANCHNKAASKDEYCTEDTCISPETGRRMFGCKSGLTKVAEDGFQQYVENPLCDFFDLSEVVRPADRNCYGWKADYLQKAASEGYVIGGAELAELYALENGQLPLTKAAFSTQQNALLTKLAALERQLNTDPTIRQRAIACAFNPLLQPPMDLSQFGAPGSMKMATALKALVGQKVAMPVRDFVRLVCAGDAVKTAALTEGVLQRLPGVYNRMIQDVGSSASLSSNPYAPATALAPASQRAWASKNAQWYSLEKAAVENRVHRSALRSLPIPALLDPDTAKSASEGAEEVARQYALMKLAFLGALTREPDFAELCELAVLQNYVA